MNACIAVVGVGSIGSRHIDHLLAMGYTDLVGVDTRPMPHDERLPIVSTFEDIGALAPTHVLICTPPEFHYHHAKWFLERGVRTFIEKPMTMTATEARTLCAIAHMNKQEIAVGYMERAHAAVLTAKRWATEHFPTKAEIFCYWRATKKSYELNVCDESSHAIDTALFVIGDAWGAKRRGGVGVRAHVVLAQESAAYTDITMDMDATPRRRINLYACGGNEHLVEYGTTAEEWDACYRAELQAFLNGKPLCTGEDGAKVVEILEQIR